MKKLLLLLFAISLSSLSFGQSAKEMLAEINGKWELDNNRNVTFVRVIEVPGVSKEDLYVRALSYFTYTYVSGDDVVQVEDKEAGTIIGKGVYPKVHIGVNLVATTVNTWHILRVDVKDGRVRAIVTLTSYENIITGGYGGPSVAKFAVSERYPIVKKDPQKTIMSKAFYKSYKAAMASLDGIERSLKEGNTGNDVGSW